MIKLDKRTLYLRWVAANGLGELFGLGLTFIVGAAAITRMGSQPGVFPILGSFGVAVVSGTIEATIVGLAQWWAMHPYFPGLARRAWWLATLLGALLAYILGYLPSTLMSLGEQTASQDPTVAEPPEWLILILAALLGAVAGAALSFAQWLAMRGKIARASLWIPANMLAWLVGMPIIFWSIDKILQLNTYFQQILLAASILYLVGSIVGAIHGGFLVRIYEGEQLQNQQRVV